eukprot:3605414-Pyramimonas_sp.AAC.2
MNLTRSSVAGMNCSRLNALALSLSKSCTPFGLVSTSLLSLTMPSKVQPPAHRYVCDSAMTTAMMRPNTKYTGLRADSCQLSATAHRFRHAQNSKRVNSES